MIAEMIIIMILIMYGTFCFMNLLQYSRKLKIAVSRQSTETSMQEDENRTSAKSFLRIIDKNFVLN